ncbi:MarR family transcriptional regulator [Streptomyces sp. NPDC026673]|uniref:MarR family winged helix-turn-helix transcriptional regulator n=1 Tax=Streptomyces sp. NPDC026673 TaxID=3155724 RepID=UPI0033C4B68B
MSETHWLTDEEQRVWRLFIAVARKLNAHLDHQLRTTSGIPATYYEILVHLSEAPDRSLRMAAIADKCFSARGKVSHAVAKLEKSGYVLRTASDSDGRGFVATLTDYGLAALHEAAARHVEEVRQYVFDPLTQEQQKALEGISATMLEMLVPACRLASAKDL